MTRLQYAGLMVCVIALAAFAQKKPEHKTALVKVTVVRETNGKPVKNAEVVLHQVIEGKQRDEALELKTHEDGRAESGGIPYGKVRIQVIAQGFRTFGQDYDIDQPSLDITIKMQPPKDQFSIYK
ncbi:MAG TPA: carboxypeptidase-like regulatory domain-containing protein [Candidatus Angelobacter sp.]